MAGNVYICNTLSWNSVQFVRFESISSCKHCYAYTEYYIDFRGVKSQLNLSKTKTAYSRFVSFTEEEEEELLPHGKKKIHKIPRAIPLLFLREWNQTRENSHSSFPFIFRD